MAREKLYKFNKNTLTYEACTPTRREKIVRWAIFLVCGLLVSSGYFYLYHNVFRLETPKMLLLSEKNGELLSKMELLNQRMENKNRVLTELQLRDNVIYRSIFGMEEIPQEVRNAGFGGVNRYEKFKSFYNAELLASSAMKMDVLTKKAYIQSKSFDDIEVLSKRAGDMASCIPTLFPVSTDKRNRITSAFGYRLDPFRGTSTMHRGVDIAGTSGEPIYVTGDGVVEEVGYNFFGYGNFVIVDHGFGYKTRYAHIKSSNVAEGQKVRRGDQIAEMGNTGRSSGTHLHYEVIYKSRPINPWNFFNNKMDPKEYATLVKPKQK